MQPLGIDRQLDRAGRDRRPAASTTAVKTARSSANSLPSSSPVSDAARTASAVTCGASSVEDHMVLRPEILDDVRPHVQARVARPRPSPHVRSPSAGCRGSERPWTPAAGDDSGRSKLTSANETRRFVISASIRFIDGEPMNAATNRFAGRWNSVLRRVELLQQAVAQHGDPLPERHRLDLVVRDVDGRHAEPLVQLRELGAHRHAQLCVEVRERLVHQERLRLAHDRAPHRDALALAARRAPPACGRAARRARAIFATSSTRRSHLRLRQLLQLQPEGEVLARRVMCG